MWLPFVVKALVERALHKSGERAAQFLNYRAAVFGAMPIGEKT
jgi:hypothetical protein